MFRLLDSLKSNKMVRNSLKLLERLDQAILDVTTIRRKPNKLPLSERYFDKRSNAETVVTVNTKMGNWLEVRIGFYGWPYLECRNNCIVLVKNWDLKFLVFVETDSNKQGMELSGFFNRYIYC